MCRLYIYTTQYLKEIFTVRCIIFFPRTSILGKQTIIFFALITIIQSVTSNINVNTATYNLFLSKKKKRQTRAPNAGESPRFRIEEISFIFSISSLFKWKYEAVNKRLTGYKLWKKISRLHTTKLQKFLNSTLCKSLEWHVMNEKRNSNSMRNMCKNNTSVLI